MVVYDMAGSMPLRETVKELMHTVFTLYSS